MHNQQPLNFYYHQLYWQLLRTQYLSSVIRHLSSESNINTNEIISYTYDNADRLTQVIYPDTTNTYSLDKVGNRQTESIDDGASTLTRNFSYNTRDQLTAITDTNGLDITYQYDPAGNQTQKNQNGQITNFAYTPRQRAGSISINGSPAIEYQYDYAGQRVNVQTSSTEKRYLYDGLTLIAETNVIGNTIARYHYGQTSQLAETRNGSNAFFLQDALGTTVAITNQDGSIQNRMDYDAWGNLNQEIATSDSPFGFTGHQKDDDTGLYYANARYYDSFTGRFLREDPLEGNTNEPPSLHRYMYANANPTFYVDPTGKYGEEGHYYTTYFVALTMGYNADEARELAIFSQFPDEVEAFDATALQARAVSTSGERIRISDIDDMSRISENNNIRSSRNNNVRDSVQSNVHSLTGGLSRLATEASIETILDSKSIASSGVAIHLLADSFAHRKIGNEQYLYPTGYGHYQDGKNPDLIHLRPELYLEYVSTLAGTLATKRGVEGSDKENAVTFAQNIANQLLKSANGGEVQVKHARSALYKTFEIVGNGRDDLIDDFPSRNKISIGGLLVDALSDQELSEPTENISNWVAKNIKRLSLFSNDLKAEQIRYIAPFLNDTVIININSMSNEEIFKFIEEKLADAVRETTNNNKRNAIKLADNLTTIIQE